MKGQGLLVTMLSAILMVMMTRTTRAMMMTMMMRMTTMAMTMAIDDDVISYHYASHLEDGSEVEAIPYHHLVPGLLNIAMKLSCHASFCCHALAM